MNTNKNQKLIFSKHVITELNDTEVSNVNGGTSPMSILSCSFCINSSNGATVEPTIGGPLISINNNQN